MSSNHNCNENKSDSYLNNATKSINIINETTGLMAPLGPALVILVRVVVLFH